MLVVFLGAIDAETDIYQLRLNEPSALDIAAQPSVTLAGALTSSMTTDTGNFIVSREGSTSTFILQNGDQTDLSQAEASFNSSYPIYIGARYYPSAPTYGNKRIAFVFFGRTLTPAQASTP